MAQYIYGRNTVLSALKEHKVKSIYIANGFSFTPIINEIKKQEIKPQIVSKKELDKFSDFSNHQGIVATLENDYSYISLEQLLSKSKNKQYPLIIMLDGIKDPHNFGAILRSADAFGVDGIIIKKNGQVQLNSTVAKVSTGAIDYVPVCMVTNLTQVIEKMKKEGFWVVASDGGATLDYRSVDYKMPVLLVIGSEGEGISRLILENSDFVTKIQMVGHVNSLNASVATALYLAQIFNNRFPS